MVENTRQAAPPTPTHQEQNSRLLLRPGLKTDAQPRAPLGEKLPAADGVPGAVGEVAIFIMGEAPLDAGDSVSSASWTVPKLKSSQEMLLCITARRGGQAGRRVGAVS